MLQFVWGESFFTWSQFLETSQVRFCTNLLKMFRETGACTITLRNYNDHAPPPTHPENHSKIYFSC